MESEENFLQGLLDDIESGKLVLPTLPEVALRVRDTVEDENATASQIANVITQDAALSARLLQVANSPLYRARNPIENVQAAIARMGSTQVRNLVSSLAMQQMFQATDEVLDNRFRAVWEHNVQVAAISQMIASTTPGLKKDQAMLAGLIHDIGVLPILMYAGEATELLEDENSLDRMVDKLHPALGKMILTKWDFPETLIAVAAEHENLQRDPGTPADYVDIVIVANLQSYIGTDHSLSKSDWSSVPAFARLDITPEVDEVDIEENKEAIEGMQKMIA